MNTATKSSEDFTHLSPQEQQDQVISFLESIQSQQLLDEIQMLTAMFEDARVYFMTKKKSDLDPSSYTIMTNSHVASQASSPAASASSETKNNDDDKKKPTKDLPAISVHVPLRTLEGDGESTLASVQLSIILENPDLFPNTSEISINFKSLQLAPQLRSDLSDSLLQYAKELQESESLTIAALASRAEEILLDLPINVQSKYFGCCLNCNKTRLAQGHPKVPQPLRLELDEKGNLLTFNDFNTGAEDEKGLNYDKIKKTRQDDEDDDDDFEDDEEFEEWEEDEEWWFDDDDSDWDSDDDDDDDDHTAATAGQRKLEHDTKKRRKQERDLRREQREKLERAQKKLRAEQLGLTKDDDSDLATSSDDYDDDEDKAAKRRIEKERTEKLKKIMKSPVVSKSTSKPQCLMCKSDMIILVPSMRPTKRTECSFCYCEDHPLITLESCSCVCCFDCFVRFAELTIGARKLKRPLYTNTFRGAGVPCPNHARSSILNDPGLMKLLPRRSFLQFASFATKDFILGLGGFVCANPGCKSGVPQISCFIKRSFTGNSAVLVFCLFCERSTCITCGKEAFLCECERIDASYVKSHRISLSELRQRLYRQECSKVPIACPVEWGDVLCVLGETQKIINVPFHTQVWREYVHSEVWDVEIIPRKQRYNTYICVFNGSVLNPSWTLRENGVHPGGIIFLIPCHDNVVDRQVQEEIDLWKFRRENAHINSDPSKAKENTDKFLEKNAKKCPGCGVPSIHYRNHRCHHISCRCGKEWCYNCGGPYPCVQAPKCPVFCNERCSCSSDCPECSPFFSCDLCQGCARCKPDGVDQGKYL